MSPMKSYPYFGAGGGGTQVTDANRLFWIYYKRHHALQRHNTEN